MRLCKISFPVILFAVINSLFTGVISGQVTAPDTSGYLPYFFSGALKYNLILAASRGYDTEIQRLVLMGAEVDSETEEGVTPLIYAVAHNRLKSVKTLLNLGADPNKATNREETPLLVAVKNYYSNYYINENNTRTRNNYQYLDIAEALIRNGANINYQDKSGVSALNYCSIYGLYNFADLLLYYGAEIDLKSNDGTTPLMAAVWTGFPDVADLLIKNGANIESRDNEGFTPFLIAAQNGDTTIMSLLLKNGIDMYETNLFGWNAVELTIKSNQTEALEYLLRKGDKWDSQGNSAVTPYSVASKYGRKEIAGILEKNNLKRASRFKVDQMAVAASAKFTRYDFYSGFSFEFTEPMYGFGINAGFDTKIWDTRVLKREDDKLYIQYKGKSSVAYAGIKKDFRLTDHIFRGNNSIYTSLDIGYFFGGKFKGTDKMPEKTFKVIPSAGFKWTKKNLSIFAGAELMTTEFESIGPLWGRAGISYRFFFDNVRAPGKIIKWY